MKKEEQRYYVVFGLVTILFFIVHFVALERIPAGINIDEAGMGYDAWCLANYGVDRFLNSYPMYLMNTGGGQSVFYCYLTMVLVKLFGLHVWVMRMPVALFSVLTVVYGIKILKMRYGNNRKLILLFFFLFTITPYFIMQSRFGLDCNLMLGMSTVFLYYMIFAIEKQRKRDYFLAGITGGLVLYTYALSYFMMPLFLIIMCVYLICTKKARIQSIVIMAIPMGILALPLIVVQVINIFDLPQVTFAGVTFTKLLVYRGNELSVRKILPGIYTVAKSILCKDGAEYNSTYFTNMHWIAIPFIVTGVIKTFIDWIKGKEEKYTVDVILVMWMFAECFVGCLVGAQANTYRLNGVFLAVFYFEIKGIRTAYLRYTNKKGLYIAVLFIYLISFLGFSAYYVNKFQKPAYLFAEDCTEAYEAVKLKKQEKTIYINQNYIYFFCNNPISPYLIDLPNHLSNVETNYFLRQYDNIYFKLPDMEEGFVDAYYILPHSNEAYASFLKDNGCSEEEYGGFKLFYKAQE